MKKITGLIISINFVLTGCAYEGAKKSISDVHQNSETLIKSKTEEAISFTKRPVVTHAKTIWIGSKSVPLDKESTLPKVFSQDVTLGFTGKMRLAEIAEKLTTATGIPVRLKPDVFMPASMFVSAGMTKASETIPPGAPSLNNASTGSGMLPAPLAKQSTVAYPYSSGNDYTNAIEVDFNEKLKVVLNRIASGFGINWEYNETDGIVFSKLVTKSFIVKANPGNSSLSASLGKGGSSSGNSSNTFSSDGQVKMNSEFSVWDSFQKIIETIKTPVGKFHISQATGSVTITDTKDVVDLAEKLIASENAMLTKQVAIRLEMYSVSSKKNLERGVNWDVIYTKFSQLAPKFSLNITTPSTLTSEMAGSMGLSILEPLTNGSGLQALNGSSAFVKALEEEGKVSRVQSITAMTLNRQPVPIGVTNQTSYLARTTAGSAGVGAALPGLEPGQVTTGFLVNLLPTVLDSNSVLLQFSIDLTELLRLGITSTGFGATQQSIQTPDTSGTQFVQRVALKAGSTLVLTGYERNRSDYDQRGLTKSVGLGGSFVGNNNRESIIIMVTPMIVDGAS